MVSHVEMAGAAAGFKLFGKVIMRASARASPPDGVAPSSWPTTAHAPSSGRASVEQLEEAARARAAAAEARLPCPRCRSEDTKFCYFNNYNVNQPRHFCRACHRYWTAGGAIRNVPVGSGRRKNRPPPPPHASAAAAAAVDCHRLLVAGSMLSPAPGLTFGFPADHNRHGWSTSHVGGAAAPPPAYNNVHGEMEQHWWLLHANPSPVGSSEYGGAF